MFRRTIAIVAALAVALAVVSLSAAAHQRTRHAQRHPHRIVSLSPTMTEDLFAIGAGKQVVAVDEDSNYPRRAPRTKLSGFTPNVEAIAGYHPDLVLISYNPGSLASQLRKLGIKVVDEPAVKNVKRAYREILGLGRLTGHVRGAHAVVQSMRTRLAAIVRSVPGSRRHLRVYHELDSTYYTATSKTFIGSIYKLFGFRDIADGADSTGGGYPQLSAEYIVQQNPQIIVLADTKCCQQTAATVAARPGWGAIAAVRHHRVVGVDDDIASRWGPRIVQFARAVARIARKG
ncbi:MAG TPA: ABC transporter substrate-binding protein [Gaiellaceae bacterium]|nr:ABC transporter substrate-binding protein [Gaiellaceae bacterium]